MTRQECESKILEKLMEIDEIHKEYNPKADYLSLCINNSCYTFNNRYWQKDEDDEEDGADVNYPLNFFTGKEGAE